GGYIAGGTYAGSGGYLVRYAPETGIESEEPSAVITLGVSPNPFSSSVNISFDIPEAAPVELSVYDLSGRVVERLISGSAASGEHLSVWNPGVSVPAGCYMARLSTSCGSTSVMCVYLK
ncbi:MAG: T9SS type A sorting domain-containing protein, partial [Candidatus Sabulitectum sp.]|nr:T9SS type A sorting domain-containing protein [Candidatus Sabulitectum sp.]